MILRIAIEDSDPKRLIDTLKRYTDSVVKAGELPRMQILSNAEPRVIGDAITYQRQPKKGA